MKKALAETPAQEEYEVQLPASVSWTTLSEYPRK
jgi:hypothetical protein